MGGWGSEGGGMGGGVGVEGREGWVVVHQYSIHVIVCLCLSVDHRCDSFLVSGPISTCILDVVLTLHPLECGDEPLPHYN